MSGSGNQQWKTPSASHQAKYNLVPIPDLEPTEEEQKLLGFYDTIRSFERQAARLKDAAARAKLAAKDAEFQNKSSSAANAAEPSSSEKKRKRSKKAKKTATSGGDDGGGEDGAAAESDDDESLGSEKSMDENEQQSSYERREEKLQALREEIEAKMGKASKEEQDELRQELLATSAETAEGPAIKRKKIEHSQEKSSLISSIENQSTPPHDFSKKLEIKAWNGKVLFPTSDDTGNIWSPPADAESPEDGAFTVELENFDVNQAQNATGPNTLAIKFMAPQESKRFSLNIAAPDHSNFDSVLFHFNPRQFERGGQLVLNNKQSGMWGQAINIPLSQVPLIFGQTSCTLIVQVNGEGFDVFMNEKQVARLEHRRELSSGSLFLNFPATDDYNHPENWQVYKVWWGMKPLMAKADMTGVPGFNNFNSLHPRKLFLSKLPKLHTEQELDLRRAELERAFRKYGGDRGATVIVPKNSTFAFVELESERQCDLALNEMALNVQYRITRARRTRHEALQEERAAAEAGKQGTKKETGDWD